MKKLILAALAVSVMASVPAHAISEGYRKQLERSGCNQDNDQVTCDSTKSKAWNQTHTYTPPAPQKREPVSKYVIAELMGIKGMTMPAAEKYLTAHGWTKMARSKYVWEKGGNNMDYTLKNGHVDNISVR